VKRARPALAVVLPTLLAAALTATRLPYRWNQVALAYAAYYREYFHTIDVHGLPGLLSFVGMHPPAYSLLFLGMTEAGASPTTWLLVSGLCSVTAVAAVALTALRAGLEPGVAASAACVLAVSPHRLAYALEPNNYPLLLAVIGVQALVFADFVRGSRRGILLALVTALGLWTHALFVVVPLAQAAALVRDTRRKTGWVALGAAVLMCGPLVPAVLSGMGSTVNPGGLGLAAQAMLLDFPARYGSAGAGWVVAVMTIAGATVAIRGPDVIARSWALQLLGSGVLIAAMLVRGTAAAHQFPYYLVLLVPSALLVGRALGVPRLALAGPLLLLSVGASLQWSLTEAARGREVWRTAAVTRPMVARAVGSWDAGAALILLGMPAGGDDDKDVIDPAYALVPRTLPVSHTAPHFPRMVAADPYWGQPYGYPEQRWLYTFTNFASDRFQAILRFHRGAGSRVLVVVYDTERAPEEAQSVRSWAETQGARTLRGPDAMLFVFE